MGEYYCIKYFREGKPMSATEPIRNKRHIRELAEYYLLKGNLRNYLLVVLGLHSALRVSDLLHLRWRDVYDFGAGRVRRNVTLTEKKTGKPKSFALNKSALGAIALRRWERPHFVRCKLSHILQKFLLPFL
jgi:integrase